MSIATALELAQARALTAVPTGMDDVYDQAITLALGTVRDETRQRLDYVADDAVGIPGSGAKVLLLPELPVVDVSSVIVRYHPDDDDETLVEDTDYTVLPGDDGRLGVLNRLGTSWPTHDGTVTVTYSHGYGGASPYAWPDGLKAIVLRLAGRGLANPDGLAQQTVGRWSGTYGAALGMTLSAQDKLALEGYLPGRRH